MCDESYYAGLVDGEGYIGIRTVRYTHTEATSFAPQVTVTIAHEQVLRAGQERWGGSMHAYHKTPDRPLVWKWQLTASQAGKFLAELLPYLRVKQRQAELVLLLTESIERCHKKVSPEEWDYRRQLQESCRALNQRRYFEDYLPRVRPVGGGCLTCGCNQPSNRHGNQDNITVGDMKRAAKAGDTGTHHKAARNAVKTLKRRGK